ncbi:hypothetical protein EGM97_01350 [Pseudomonas sp. AF32]|nr:hypothetical protein [Pseudomonas sp. AF32]
MANDWFNDELLWERACSRRRRHIQHLSWLPHRFREQARSHSEGDLSGDLCHPLKSHPHG